MNKINFLKKPKINFLSLKYLELHLCGKKLNFNNCVFATCTQKKHTSTNLRSRSLHPRSLPEIWDKIFPEKRSPWDKVANTPLLKNQINKLDLINRSVQHLKTNHYIYNHQIDKKDLAKKNCFWNQCFDKSRLKNFVLWFLLNHGEYKTVELVEQLKNLGFNYATKAGISLGIDDLKIPPKKADLIIEAEKLTFLTVNEYKRGEITGVERFQRLIDTWHHTSERLKQEVIDYFEATDILNPVYMMAFSGARGNISQVRQLVGMRGLMANPQGQIIDFPIRSNFREGLTLTEYIISSYGARKGIVDTALRTANAGYLTRRLVDVAQHVIISNFDCKTSRGIFLTDMKEGNKTIYSLQNRLVGRVLAKNIYSSAPHLKSKKNINNKKEGNNVSQGNDYELTKDSSRITSAAFLVARRNSEISLDLAFEISKVSSLKKVFVRSALTCQTKKLVCQLCYGWSLAQGNLVSIGEAVGVVAAQSIGEPGTQLTMRTFHTGGVFSGDVTDQIKSPFDGFVEYLEPIAGELIRTPEGRIAFLTKNEGSFVLKKHNSSINDETTQTKKYKIPSYTLIFKRMGEHVVEREVIAQISSISRQKNATDDAELTIKSEIEGQFYGKFLQLQENKIGPKLKEKERKLLKLYQTFSSNVLRKTNNSYLSHFNSIINKFPLDTIYEAWDWGYAWILAGKIYQLSFPSSFFPILGDFVNRKTTMNQTKWRFHVESAATFLELNPCLTQILPTKKKQLNFIKKKGTLKNKHLVSAFFKIKNNSAQRSSLINQTYKRNISQTQGQLIQNRDKAQIDGVIPISSRDLPETGKATVNLNKKIISSFGNKNLDNSINFPIIKNSVLSFDIQKVFYKKVGYLMTFNKGIDPLSLLNKRVIAPLSNKTKRLNIEINQNKPFKQLSNLSKDDILVLLSALKKNTLSSDNDANLCQISGSKEALCRDNPAFLNLNHQNKVLKRSNFFSQEINNLNGSVLPLNNKSTSFSTSNWLPNKKFILNWYPKNSQIQTSGLFFIEQNHFTGINSFSASSVTSDKKFEKKNAVLSLFVKTNCVTTDQFKINLPYQRSAVSSLPEKRSSLLKKINNPLFLKKDSTIKDTNLKKISFDQYPEKKSEIKQKSKIVTLPLMEVKNTFNDFKVIKLKSNNFIDTLSMIKEKKYKLNLNSSVNSINSLILNDLKLSFRNPNLFSKKYFIKKKNLSKPSHYLNEHFKDSFCQISSRQISSQKISSRRSLEEIGSRSLLRDLARDLFSAREEIGTTAGELSSFLLRKELLKKIANQQIKKCSNNIPIKTGPLSLKKPSEIKHHSAPVFVGTLFNNAFEKNKVSLIKNKLKKKENLEVSTRSLPSQQISGRSLRKRRSLDEEIWDKTATNFGNSQVLIYHLNKEQKLKSIHFGMRWKNPYNYKNIHFKHFLTKLYTNSKKLKIKQNSCLTNKANLFSTSKEDLNTQSQSTTQFNRKDTKKIGNQGILTINKPNGINSKYKLDSIHTLYQQNDKKPTSLTRIFFTPQIFCQINATFSVILNQSHFINSEINPPLFYLINRQGFVKFFYISQPDKEKPQRNLINFSSQPITNCMPLKSFFIQKIRLNNTNDLARDKQAINLEKNHKSKKLCDSTSASNKSLTKKTPSSLAVCVTKLTKKNIVHLLNDPSKKILLSYITNSLSLKKKVNLKIKKKLVKLLRDKTVWFLRTKTTNKNLQGFFSTENQEDKIKGFISELEKKNSLPRESINSSTLNQLYNVNQTINFNFLIQAFNLKKKRKINGCFKSMAKQKACQRLSLPNPSVQVFLNKTLSVGKPFKFNIYSINKENIGWFVTPVLSASRSLAAEEDLFPDLFSGKGPGVKKRTTPVRVYFSRFLFCYASFYNSSCLNLKSFSKTIIYMLIIKNKLYSNSQRKLWFATKNTKSFKNQFISIFNISVLRQNKKEKTFNKNILSPFIKLEIKKNSIIRSRTIKKWSAPDSDLSSTQLIVSKKSNSLNNDFIKNKNLCSNKDVNQISENPRIQIKKLNTILSRFFCRDEIEKSILQSSNVISRDEKNLNLDLLVQQISSQSLFAARDMGSKKMDVYTPVALSLKKYKQKIKKTNIKKLNQKNWPIQRRANQMFTTLNDENTFAQKNLIEENKIYPSLRNALNFVPKFYDSKNQKNIGFQVKFGWVYISKNLYFATRKYLSLNQRFILPGNTLLDDLIFDNNSSYLEYISLKKNQTKTKTNPSRKINILDFKKLQSLDTWKWVSNKESRFIPSFHKQNCFNNFSVGILIRKVNEYKQSSLQNYKNEIYNFSNIKNKLIQYSLDCYATPRFEKTFFNINNKLNFSYNLKKEKFNYMNQARTVTPYLCKNSPEKYFNNTTQLTKSWLTGVSRDLPKSLPSRSLEDLFPEKKSGKRFGVKKTACSLSVTENNKQQQELNKKLFNKKLHYYFLQIGLTNHLMFKVKKGLINVNKSILNNKYHPQLVDLSFSPLIKQKQQLKKSKNTLCFNTKLNSFKLLTIFKKIAQLRFSLSNKPTFLPVPEDLFIQRSAGMNRSSGMRSSSSPEKRSAVSSLAARDLPLKKKLISRKCFINKSYSSMALLHLQFKKSLMNKQKMTLQTISTFPNIDLNISSTFKLYYLNKRFTSVYETIFNSESISEKLNRKSKNFNPTEISFSKSINHFNKQISTSKQSKSKKNVNLTPQSHLKTNRISLPLFSRKPINFASFLVSFKQPYGLNRTFNSTFSFFNYKNNLTFSLQKLNNSSYLSQFLEKYILKLLVCQSKTLNLQKKVQYQINPSSNKLSDSFKNRRIANRANDFFYFSGFFISGDKTSSFSSSRSLAAEEEDRAVPLIISLEIISLLPIIFNCPYFSYNLIEKLEKTLMAADNNFNKSSNLLSEKHITKLNLLSKKISLRLAPQIKTQFFSSFENKFSLSEPIAKTSAYSSFEGEFIYKKDLNSFFSKNKKRRFITEKLFPIYTQNVALILTRQDLISFSLNPNKKLNRQKNQFLSPEMKQTFRTQNFFVRNSKIGAIRKLISQSEKKEKYYLNDIIIKFQKINQLSNSLKDSSPIDSEKTNQLKETQINHSIITTRVKVSKLGVGLPFQFNKLSLGEFFMYGDRIKNNLAVFNTGQIIHLNQEKLTLRKGQPIFISPKAIFHKYHGDLIDPNSSVITLAYSQLKTGDIIQGIPKVEQFFEARTTKRGRLFRDSLPNLLKALFKRYVFKLPFEKAVRQSFYKIQQIIVDGVQRVYRSQGVSIADKHLEIIVKQMTSKVRISFAGVTGFFPGEVVDLDLVEHVNTYVTRKVQYEPLVLGITKASLEVNSFLSAASFQQTTRVLSKAALTRKRDFLRGLKENVILGNLIPAGTGLLVYLEKKKTIDSIVEEAFEEKKRYRRRLLFLHPRFKPLKHRTFLFKHSLFKRYYKLYTLVNLLTQNYQLNYKQVYKHNFK